VCIVGVTVCDFLSAARQIHLVLQLFGYTLLAFCICTVLLVLGGAFRLRALLDLHVFFDEFALVLW
jgi:hypothetical protein